MDKMQEGMKWEIYRQALHGQKACKAHIGQTRSRLSLASLDLECTTTLKLEQTLTN